MCASLNTYLQLCGNPERFRLWGNGASFDNAIIRNVYAVQGYKFPIPFWNDRDMRTIVGFYPDQLAIEWKRNNLRKGTHHNALDDAKHQVRYCNHILQELGVKQLY
jgi:exodeoxyribonuclease VIII